MAIKDKLNNQHDRVMALVHNPDLPRTLDDEAKIAELQNKGLQYVLDLPLSHELRKDNNFQHDDFTKSRLVALAIAVEKMEHSQKSMDAPIAVVTLDEKSPKQERVRQQEQVEALLSEMTTHGKQKNNKLTPTNAAAKKDKDMADETEPQLDAKPMEPSRVNLDPVLIAQTITALARQKGEIKEKELPGTPVSESGFVPRSVIIDASPQTVVEAIYHLDQRVNPVKKPVEAVVANNTAEAKKDAKASPSPKPEFRPEAAKNDAKEMNKTPEPKPVQAIMIANLAFNPDQINIPGVKDIREINPQVLQLASDFLLNQQYNPMVIQREQLGTVVPKGIKDKQFMMSRVLEMRNRHVEVPQEDYKASTEALHGVPTQRRMTARGY